MGKKGKRRLKKLRKNEGNFANHDAMDHDLDKVLKNQDPKSRSKLSKKLRKKLMKQEGRRVVEDNVNGERCGYHMVTVFVKDDVTMDKTFLLSSIGNYVDVPFCPLGYFRGNDCITFYFDSNNDVASSIKALDKRIQSPSGMLMGMKVSFCDEPNFILNCNQVELLKNVILKRCVQETCLLNLSALHLDPSFVESNTFVPLSNERILKQVVTFIKEIIPNVNAIDLSNNKLKGLSLKTLQKLSDSCSALFALNLENNNISASHYLRHLKTLHLKELKLAGNKFNKNTRSSQSKYIKSVKKELPFLKVLDGQDISAFKSIPDSELLKSATLKLEHPSPLSKLAAAPSDPPAFSITEDKLKTFLEQYYSLVDTPQKEALLQAYIPTAKIELKSENPLVPSSLLEGQNLIQEFLRSWPATKHDHAAFNLQILSLADDKGVTQVTGSCLFVEPQVALQFRRTMEIVPLNGGLCCSADLLEIL